MSPDVAVVLLEMSLFLTCFSLFSVFLFRLTGYGIHHCFARSMMDPEAQGTTIFPDFYTHYYTMAGIAVASCIALCPAVCLMGRRGGLLLFMIITALASLLQLGLLNCEYYIGTPITWKSSSGSWGGHSHAVYWDWLWSKVHNIKPPKKNS